jgi:hypothetical protein
MKKGRAFYYIDRVTLTFEFVIAFVLLITVALKLADLVLQLLGINFSILTMDFERVLSVIFALVIGVEFIRMLCKHTPETVVDVLLFAIARQMVLSQGTTTDMLLGVLGISGLFAAKKYLIDSRSKTTKNRREDEE